MAGTVAPPQTVRSEGRSTCATGLTTISKLTGALLQVIPLIRAEPVTVTVEKMGASPALKAVNDAILPLPAAIGNTLVLEFDQLKVVPDTVEAKVIALVTPPELITCVGTALTTTAGLTVMVLVATASEQLPVPAMVYVMVAVPPATPLTTPAALTVATLVLVEDQVPPVTVELKFVNVPAHIS